MNATFIYKKKARHRFNLISKYERYDTKTTFVEILSDKNIKEVFGRSLISV